MSKLEITGKETDDELTVKILTILSELCAGMVGDVAEAVRSAPGGLEGTLYLLCPKHLAGTRSILFAGSAFQERDS